MRKINKQILIKEVNKGCKEIIDRIIVDKLTCSGSLPDVFDLQRYLTEQILIQKNKMGESADVFITSYLEGAIAVALVSFCEKNNVKIEIRKV
jgi:hypothetical protein